MYITSYPHLRRFLVLIKIRNKDPSEICNDQTAHKLSLCTLNGVFSAALISLIFCLLNIKRR
jgi:hypothetical protein